MISNSGRLKTQTKCQKLEKKSLVKEKINHEINEAKQQFKLEVKMTIIKVKQQESDLIVY
jgi:hypothetical protein